MQRITPKRVHAALLDALGDRVVRPFGTVSGRGSGITVNPEFGSRVWAFDGEPVVVVSLWCGAIAHAETVKRVFSELGAESQTRCQQYLQTYYLLAQPESGK